MGLDRVANTHKTLPTSESSKYSTPGGAAPFGRLRRAELHGLGEPSPRASLCLLRDRDTEAPGGNPSLCSGTRGRRCDRPAVAPSPFPARLSGTAQHPPRPRALPRSSHRASRLRESARSGPAPGPSPPGAPPPQGISASPGEGGSDSRPCRPNLKLHKRNPSQSLPQLPLPSRTLLRSTPPKREPPKSCLPLTWAALAAASSEGRPSTTSASGHEPPGGGTPSSRCLLRRPRRGLSGGPRAVSWALPNATPSRALTEPALAPVGSPQRRLGRLFPSLTDVPSPRIAPRSASPLVSQSSAAGLWH